MTIVAALACLTLTGCMTYSHKSLPEVSQWPLESVQKKPSAYIKVQTEYSFNGTPKASNPNIARRRADQKGVRRQRSLLPSEHRTRSLGCLRDRNLAQPGNRQSRSGGDHRRAFLIPGTFDNTLIMDMTFRDGEGRKVGQVQKQETLTTWMHLFLVFALPFNGSGEEILGELAKSNLEAAAQKNLI